MIQEIKLNGLDNKPIKTTKKPPPRSINKDLPPCYFTSIFIGSKGSGKTYSLIKLFKNYDQYPIYDNDGHKLDIRNLESLYFVQLSCHQPILYMTH